MKKILLILCLIASSVSYAQSNLPPCSGDYWNNCFGAYDFPGGNKYEGQWKDNKKNGQGTYTFANGNKYVGQFKDDQKNGQGTFTWADGEKYEGQFKDGKPNGQGTYTFANGNKYAGQFKDDKYDGFGTFYFANGSIYQQGIWRNGEFVQAQTTPPVIAPVVPKPTVNNAQDISYAQSNLPPCNGNFVGPCFGAIDYPNGDKYVGQFIDGKRNGQGTYTYTDGGKYVGEWKGGNKNGQGTYTYPSGSKYVGQFKDNQRNGQGTLTSADGYKYVGEWKGDNKNGQGTITWANGDKYVGEWEDDNRTGQGTYTSADGWKYVGQYRGGEKNGQGTYTYADGYKYVGGWKDGDQDGFGTVYKANGSIYQQGIWREGIFVRQQTLLEFNPPVVPKPPTPTNNAFGADWDLVRSGRDMDDYYDRGSINKSVSNGVTTITFNRLSQRETPKELGDKYYLSKTWSLVIRCQTNQYTDGYIKYYSKRWASGSMVGKYDAYDNWEVIPYGDVLDLKNKFCPSK